MSLERVLDMAAQSADVEYTRLINPLDAERVLSYLSKLHFETPAITYFTPVALRHTTETIFQDPTLRLYVTAYCDRLALGMAASGISYDTDIVPGVCDALCLNRVYYKDSLIVEQFADSISLDQQVLTVLLRETFWVFALYILKMQFHRTNMIQIFMQNFTEGEK